MTEHRRGAEIGLLSLRLSLYQGKVTLWECFLYLMSGTETDEGVAKDEVFARTENRTRDYGSKTHYAIH